MILIAAAIVSGLLSDVESAVVILVVGQDKNGEFFSKLIQVPLKRRLLLRGLIQKPRDLAHLCLHPHGSHKKSTPPIGRKAAGVNHIGTVSERHFPRHGLGARRRRGRLSLRGGPGGGGDS